MNYAKWCTALALTESQNNQRAWGDQGLACGRWQMHPAFVWDYGPDNVAVRASWDDIFSAALAGFFQERAPITTDPVKLAMEFHLGVRAVSEGQWDAVYAARFQSFYEG
jgi:hypothetical protein